METNTSARDRENKRTNHDANYHRQFTASTENKITGTFTSSLPVPTSVSLHPLSFYLLLLLLHPRYSLPKSEHNFWVSRIPL
jgi:hypothetical protein